MWKELLLQGFEIPLEQADSFFVEDEDAMYNGFFQLSQDKNNWGWFYLLTQELALFKPYYPLGRTEDKDFKKLKLESSYILQNSVCLVITAKITAPVVGRVAK